MGVRYIGSKTKILEHLITKIGEIVPEGSKITDLMSGTAAVSAELRKKGYRVIANDVMTYSYHHAHVMLSFTAEPVFHGALDFIAEFEKKEDSGFSLSFSNYERMINVLNNSPMHKGYFWREYSNEGTPRLSDNPRNYFSPENAAKIDGIRKCLEELKQRNSITDLEHSLLLHDLIMAANDIANIAGTYGHYLSKLVQRATQPIKLTPSPLVIMDDNNSHQIFQEYAETVAEKIECDICYIDPPYMKRQYAANYHILETLARGDEPEAIGVSGLRPWRDQYSNFCTKTKIRDSFRKVFSGMKCPHFLISYSEDGLLTVSELENVMSEFGRVTIETLKHKRFKSNNSPLAPQLTEYILHLEVS